MKDKTINKKYQFVIVSFSILIILGIIIVFGISLFQKNSNKNLVDTKPNYEVMYNMCKSKCSNYTTFDIASKEEVGMKVVLYQNKTIKEVECLCENNNMSRSVMLW